MASWFAGLRPLAGARAAGEPPADALVSLRMADGGEASFPLRQVQGRQVTAAVPWRKTRGARGQLHYPGYFWSATMSAHVVYESRLELARLLLADFERHVTAIAAQPFLLRARVAGPACCRKNCWMRFSPRGPATRFARFPVTGAVIGVSRSVGQRHWLRPVDRAGQRYDLAGRRGGEDRLHDVEHVER